MVCGGLGVVCGISTVRSKMYGTLGLRFYDSIH